ncbi:MAG: PIN domain-containing protein [Gemmatimonadetes bacterium]|nr:PIN domain-containing protein [Gemmatimonadota bacterium]MYB98459.1 PIN domain-containing protein [Gemmatimonadota bacterium]MYI45900.1 PIN domain-containing protein [Gemmatimonadota bacterium]
MGCGETPGRGRAASGLSESEVETVVLALCAVAKPVEGWYLWRPQLRDPADEMVLEVAVNGRADALVTFNTRDFGDVHRTFGVEVLSPRHALRRLTR